MAFGFKLEFSRMCSQRYRSNSYNTVGVLVCVLKEKKKKMEKGGVMK